MLLTLIAVGGLITLGLVLASAVWASRESDLAALDRQRGLVDERMNSQLQSVSRELDLMAEGYAGSISGIVRDGGIAAFEGASFTRIITAVFGYDEAFVVWSDGELALQGDGDTADRYAWVRPLLMPMLGRAASTSGATGQEPAPSKVVELMRLQGRPSIAGVAPIEVRAEPGVAASPLFLVAYRYIDGPALDAFSQQQGLNGARFARASDPEPNEVSFQIDATGTQEPIGFVIWTPDLPGSRVVVRLVPALATSALIIAVLLSVLMLLLRRSLSDLQDSERKARHQSLHDVLTGLPNRALFGFRLKRCIDDQRLSSTRSMVALVDLDKFKAVNDTHGHAVGDELIQAVASRISNLLGPNDLLARLGGDEFALLLPDRPRDDGSHLKLCNQIIAALGRPFVLLEGTVRANIGCSIGVTTLSNVSQTASEVLHLADVALYQAKFTGRGRCVEYTAGMDTSAKLREELKADMRLVLDHADARHDTGDTGLEVFYQTIHRAGPDNVISGAEALVRWRHEKFGLLAPDKFIPFAEESGLIHRLGNLVLKRSCAAAMQWQNQGFVSVNVSPIQLRRPEFVDEVLHILDQSGLPPHRLELEVTETALMGSDEQVVNAALCRLRSQGIKIALDDFGTGYSSLSHLVQFGIDRIKIDRSFVQLLGTRGDGAAIVSALVALSHSLGLATTAEGVETEGQRDFLVAAGCSDLQGFLFSRPDPRPDMASTMPKLERRQAR